MLASRVAIFAFVALALISAYLVLSSLAHGGAPASQAYVYAVNGKTFDITLVAANASSQEKGLMNTTITSATMMVFVFPAPGIYPFWMENTYSNLDMMWLNVSGGSGTVVYLVRNATSCVGKSLGWCEDNTYYPTAEANYVIEAAAGFADANNVTVGTSVGLTKKG
jgi:uncharacterized membrane protein (UPF0127 family)